MARPQKVGVEYFPLDVDIDQDDKIAMIETLHGITGFGVLIKLLMKIYSEGYYYDWTEKQRILFAKRVNVDINQVNTIINDCIKWGIFDKKLFEAHQILTSRGIQRRYLEIVKRRQNVKIIRDFLLLHDVDINTYTNVVIADINSCLCNNNDSLCDTDVDIGTQSKVKKSKVKNKEKNNEHFANAVDNFFEQVWKLYPNKKGKTAVNKKSKEAIYELGIEKITAAIDAYKKELAKDTWKQPMYGSTFFNGRYEDYLSADDNRKGSGNTCTDEYLDENPYSSPEAMKRMLEKEGMADVPEIKFDDYGG